MSLVFRALSNLLRSLVFLLLLGTSVVVVVLFAVAEARVSAETRSYNEGLTAGQSDTCMRLAAQVRWTFNVENNMVASGRHSQIVANEIRTAANASYHYTCDPDSKTEANAYDPVAQAPLAGLGQPTIPIAARPSTISPIFMSGRPSPKPEEK